SFCIAAIAAGLVFSPMASAQPLAPGKPAGAKAARNGASTGLLLIGDAAVAAVVALVALGGNSNNNTGVLNVGTASGTTS
ncbi:MAG: hypothetical protein NTX21_06745, partial [Alphaproteobacteria bacterium]|nr:hypothetical protein [Alphaproteobacteria bacterium]